MNWTPTPDGKGYQAGSYRIRPHHKAPVWIAANSPRAACELTRQQIGGFASLKAAKAACEQHRALRL